MLIALSPAKTLDFSPVAESLLATTPAMGKDTAELVAVAKTLGRADLKRLMGLSDKLADLNVERFKAFRTTRATGAVPAALAFAGDVYTGLKARDLDADALAWAQDRLRILSGLYGVLRPLDLIQPYRLEMGVKLANPRGTDLYSFWGDRIAKVLNTAARGHADPTLVNLASQEYFGGVDRKALKIPVLTCQFKERRGDEVKIVSFFAKKARGTMARYIIDGRIEQVEALKAFDRDGYAFSPDHSDAREWVFVRDAG
ncbi:MAG: peroxide stress protein YaaA [Caulobacteraceae bacterium]